MYTVSSNEVYALTSGPKRIPDFSRNSMMVCPWKRRVPLKAMCSTKCA